MGDNNVKESVSYEVYFNQRNNSRGFQHVFFIVEVAIAAAFITVVAIHLAMFKSIPSTKFFFTFSLFH